MTWRGSRLLRYLLYSFLIFVLFIFQGTPGLFPEIMGARPILLCSVAVAIAMFEPSTAAIGFAAAAGLLLDMTSGGILGIYALIFVILAYVISILAHTVLQVNLGTAMIFAVFSTAIVVFLGWIFQFVMPGYSYAGFALTNVYIPKFFYSLLMFTLIFLAVNLISTFIRTPERL